MQMQALAGLQGPFSSFIDKDDIFLYTLRQDYEIWKGKSLKELKQIAEDWKTTTYTRQRQAVDENGLPLFDSNLNPVLETYTELANPNGDPLYGEGFWTQVDNDWQRIVDVTKAK